MCGEQSTKDDIHLVFEGSPPRVRGTATSLLWLDPCKGITPACAGNRLPYALPGMGRQDHPRVCGEQALEDGGVQVFIGSPPRVRGTVVEHHIDNPSNRITPACAGNSRPAFPGHPPPWDHPRVCGEQSAVFLASRRYGGSPPRVRGTGCRHRGRGGKYRITPACAGNSAPAVYASFHSGDHPRVCGEQLCLLAGITVCTGSPPRVRGTAYPPAAGRLC